MYNLLSMLLLRVMRSSTNARSLVLKKNNRHYPARFFPSPYNISGFLLLQVALLFFYPLEAQKPVAYYKFDNSTKDFSGNGNDGIIHGSVLPVMDRFGKHCSAYQFDGVTGYIEVPSSASLERPDRSVTITTWYRFNSRRTNYWLTAVCKGATNVEMGANPQYRLQVQQDIINSAVKCQGGSTPGFSTVSLNTGFTGCDLSFAQHVFRPFEWNFYALVFNGRKVIAYMNDQQVFEADYNMPLQKNNAPLYIGLDEPGITEYFDGALDDVNIFDQALDEQQIKKLFSEQRPVNWDNEEFTVGNMDDKLVELPAGQSTVKVSFDPPRVSNAGCGNVKITQIMGEPSNSPLSEGSHLVMYSINSESGAEEHIGFYINVKSKPVVVIKKKEPPPVPPTKQTASVPIAPTVTPKTVITKTDAPQADIPKTDTPLNIKPVVPPLIVKKDTVAKYHPKDLDKRETIEQQVVEVSSSKLKLIMYDNAQYDGDTVSVFLNNEVIISRQEVTIPGTTFYITIDSSIDNKLVVYAENLGTIPPNTALVVLYDGDKQYEIHLSSSLTHNAMIRIRKKKK